MIYLSKFQLDISAPGVRQCLANAQDMHRSLMKPFGDTRQEIGLLYRLVASNSAFTLYVQTGELPDWSSLEPYGFHCIGTKDISALTRLYAENAVLRFSLAAYPSKMVKDGSKNSKRMPLHNDDERLEWLTRAGDKYGFSILSAEIRELADTVCWRKGSGSFTLNPVEFSGVLRITDAESFWKAYASGIGPEKSYGCGMLLLSKP